MKVGVARETAAGERRVALVPEALGKLTAAGLESSSKRAPGRCRDPRLGLCRGRRDDRPDRPAVRPGRRRPAGPEARRTTRSAGCAPGQARRRLAAAADRPEAGGHAWPAKGVTAISLDALPRTLSRAQSMDALSSQANVGGYKAVLIAANAYGRYFPLLTTAAGTAKPANVLILGIGVAGLQAIGTARRLGAVVKAYDVRSETKEQAESLGATFIVLKSVADASGEGGYARELTPEEQAAQQAELNGHIATMDVVITTAQVPGRRPPLLVTADAVAGMKPGSVIVDMAASALGGNVELSKAGETTVTDNGVTIIAPDNLPATMPAGASAFYARNISALLLHLVKDGALTSTSTRRSRPATVITHGGQVVQAATKKLLEPAPAPAAGGAAHEPRAAQLAGDLRPGDPRRVRGHQQGPGHAAHPADVGRQLDPRHRPRRRHVHRGRGGQPGELRARVHRHGLRRRRTWSAATWSPTGCSRCSARSRPPKADPKAPPAPADPRRGARRCPSTGSTRSSTSPGWRVPPASSSACTR